MKTRIVAEIAAVLVACAIPAAPLACDEHKKGSQHACNHPTTGAATAGDAAAKGKRVVIPVGGMHCSRCAQRVTAALVEVKGVKWVETSLDAKQAVVVHDGARPEALATAIEGAGYKPGKPAAD